jgi:LuxR family transcriptional regulator, maltose regulon positive regulatory protein
LEPGYDVPPVDRRYPSSAASGARALPLGDTLLTTKLFVPSVRPDLVVRRRLTARMDEGVRGRLTLVSAPAGFGKTTLLGEWGLETGMPLAWVSLDEGDNDVGRFLTYVATAMGGLHENFEPEEVLGPLHEASPHLESVLTALVNEAACIPHDFALVLDDYHAINADAVHGAVTFLLEHLPSRMHVVIASRTEPPLPLARLLARGHLTRLSAADLRFAPEEVVAFLDAAVGVRLSTADVAALEERTEGWIAGLQLAALSMRDRDPKAFIHAFTGTNRYVLDYLAEEVLKKQDEDVQEFLMDTSILGRLSGSLCDGVTGRDDGQTILERLERENLFVVPLDDERLWFRYHHLFAQFLQKELRRGAPERVPLLHRRACDWFEGEGLVAEAVSHALAAGDTERAANLVERVARTTLRRGELSRLRRWLEELSEDLVCSRPRLCLFYAWYYLAAGRLGDVEPYLDRAESGAGGARDVVGEVTTIRAAIAGIMGQPALAMNLAREAEAMLTEENRFLECIIAASRGFANRGLGDVVAASEEFAEAATLARSVEATYVALLAYRQLAELLVVRGRLRAAADVCRRALDLVSERGRRLPASSAARVGMGELLYEWNELDVAEEHLREGIELAELGGNAEISLDGYLAMARTRHARGDLDGASDALEAARSLAERHGGAPWRDRVNAWEARLAATRGDRWVAERWLEDCGLSPDEPDHSREFEYVTMTMALAATGRHEDASGLLERLLRQAEEGGRGGRVVELLALRAPLMAVRGNEREAVETLLGALALAEPEGYIRTFADRGASMSPLLQAALKTRQRDARPSSRYIAELLAAFGGAETAHPVEKMERLAGAVSEREIEVLGHLAAGTTNREIADKLFVSLDTVKTHLKHVYNKLGVHSRTQAVARARELGLISDPPARTAEDLRRR